MNEEQTISALRSILFNQPLSLSLAQTQEVSKGLDALHKKYIALKTEVEELNKKTEPGH